MFKKGNNYWSLSKRGKGKFNTELKEYLTKRNAKAYYNIDIIGKLVTTGNWFCDLNIDTLGFKENNLKKFPERFGELDLKYLILSENELVIAAKKDLKYFESLYNKYHEHM